MRLSDPIEIFYLSLMQRWAKTAPPDRHYGTLDGKAEQNSQEARLAYVLQKIAAGQVEKVFLALERLTSRRNRPSYISKDANGMESPRELWNGWYLEGCASLEQKRAIIRQLKQLSLSPTFVRAVDSFVSGEDTQGYFPTAEEAEAIVREIGKREGRQHAVDE